MLNKGKVMRYRINKKDFESVFTNRKLTRHERYMQTFWLCKDEGDNYWVEQKVKVGFVFAILLFLLLCIPFILIAVILFKGLEGIGEFFDEFDFSSTVRKDWCNTEHQQNRDIVRMTLARVK